MPGSFGLLARLCEKAIEHGATVRSPGHLQWHLAGDCRNPQRIDHYEKGPLDRRLWLEMSTRCRRCEECLRHRARQWADRSAIELAFAARSWMVTLTFDEAANYLADELGQGGAMVTRWLKRARKGRKVCDLCMAEAKAAGVKPPQEPHHRPCKLRYALVAERGAGGRLHYHALVHEVQAVPIKKRDLTHAWRDGFVSAKLVSDERSAGRYVAKYLTKEPGVRVKASFRYGKAPQGLACVVTDEGTAEREYLASLVHPASRQGDKNGGRGDPPAEG